MWLKIKRVIEEHLFEEGRAAETTAIIGVASYPGDAVSGDGLIGKAVMALKEGNMLGRHPFGREFNLLCNRERNSRCR